MKNLEKFKALQVSTAQATEITGGLQKFPFFTKGYEVVSQPDATCDVKQRGIRRALATADKEWKKAGIIKGIKQAIADGNGTGKSTGGRVARGRRAGGRGVVAAAAAAKTVTCNFTF